MKLEYLLEDIQDKEKISNYTFDDFKPKFISIENGKCLYVQYGSEGKNQTLAKKLSGLDEAIRLNFNVTTLRDDASEYFDSRLYPLIETFERKMRKLLYVSNAISDDEVSKKVIVDLEEKSFGWIFSMLFVDDDFVYNVKSQVKDLPKKDFTKENVSKMINEIDETPKWDVLLGKNIVPTLRNQFNNVREIRNTVMHSKYMSWETFRNAQSLFETINEEIQTALEDVNITEDIATRNPSFSESMMEIIEAENIYRKLQKIDALANLQQRSQQLKSQIDLSALEKISSQMHDIYLSNPELAKLQQIIPRESMTTIINRISKQTRQNTDKGETEKN